MPSRAYLMRRYRYDPKSGRLFHQPRPPTDFKPGRGGWSSWNARYANKRAGSNHSCRSKTYRRLTIDGKEYLEHRIIYLIHHGFCPQFIDHRNGDGTDNRISNLVESSPSHNQTNRARNRNNKSGHTGVWFDAKISKWRAAIHVDGKRIQRGTHATKESAIAARKLAEKEFNFTPRGNLS